LPGRLGLLNTGADGPVAEELSIFARRTSLRQKPRFAGFVSFVGTRRQFASSRVSPIVAILRTALGGLPVVETVRRRGHHHPGLDVTHSGGSARDSGHPPVSSSLFRRVNRRKEI
jgi:hypothetical protein